MIDLLEAPPEGAHRIKGRGAIRIPRGYPVDVAAAAHVSPSTLFHGTASMFVDAGFAEVAHRPARSIMQLPFGRLIELVVAARRALLHQVD